MGRKKHTEYEKQIMKDVASNLKILLSTKGIQQKDICEMTGLAASTISDYVNARTLISPGNLQKISDALNVPKSKIDSSFRYNFESIEDEDVVSLPVYGNISCGNGLLVMEAPVAYEVTPKSWLNGGEYFYLQAKGDSMIGARIHDGDLLLIRKQPTVDDGDIAAVVLEDECVMKRVYYRNGSLILQSENPKYPPIVVIEGNVRIVGKLSKLVVKF